MTRAESEAMTRVPCPMCIQDDVYPGIGVQSCPLCNGDGAVLPYVRMLYQQRKMSGEYHLVPK